MPIFLYVVVGVAAGITSGLLGVGGGIIIIPLLRYLFHFTQHEAQGTSLAILLLPIGLPAVWKYYLEGYVKVPVAAWIVVGFLSGVYGGAVLASDIPDALLRRLFGIFLLLVALEMIFSHR